MGKDLQGNPSLLKSNWYSEKNSEHFPNKVFVNKNVSCSEYSYMYIIFSCLRIRISKWSEMYRYTQWFFISPFIKRDEQRNHMSLQNIVQEMLYISRNYPDWNYWKKFNYTFQKTLKKRRNMFFFWKHKLQQKIKI